MAILRRTCVIMLVLCASIAACMAAGRAQPDRGRMLFWSRQNGSAALYIVDSFHRQRARLIAPPAALVVDLPRPSRDGRRSAFEASDAGRLQVYVREGNLRTLYATDDHMEDRLPGLSPDGRLMAFWSSPAQQIGARFHNWKLMLLDFERAELRFLYDENAVIPYDNPHWSPDGRRFAVRFWHGGRDNGIFIVDVETGVVRSLRAWVDSGGDLAWSPDGDQLAFRTTRDRNAEVYTLDLTTQQLQNLSQHPANDFQPAWSPDAYSVAFVSTRTGRGEIFVIADGGGTPQQITDGGGWLPVWSPDGTQIAFVTRRDHEEALYVVAADGSQLHRVARLSADDVFLGWYAP
jgi:Tol biopolymer transport system component